MRRRDRRREARERRKRRVLLVALIVSVFVLSQVLSWWGTLPAPEEPEDVTCPEIDDVLGERTLSEYTDCQAQKMIQVLSAPFERTIYRIEYLTTKVL